MESEQLQRRRRGLQRQSTATERNGSVLTPQAPALLPAFRLLIPDSCKPLSLYHTKRRLCMRMGPRPSLPGPAIANSLPFRTSILRRRQIFKHISRAALQERSRSGSSRPSGFQSVAHGSSPVHETTNERVQSSSSADGCWEARARLSLSRTAAVRALADKSIPC